jgi:acetyl esterase/lipase
MSEEQRLALDATLRQGQLDLEADVEALRAGFNEVMARVPVAGDVRQKPTTIGGVGAVEVTIQGRDASNVILYFHGGVYVIGSAATSVSLVGDLARRAGAKAITLDYRLAPEHPYPAAVEDARAAYEGLLAQGIVPSQIALAGESAGGGLAVATLLALRVRCTAALLCLLDVALCRPDVVGGYHPQQAGSRSDPHARGPPPSGPGLRRRSECLRPGCQPHIWRPPRATPPSHPGGLARDPAQ